MINAHDLAEFLGVAREAALDAWEEVILPYHRTDFTVYNKEGDGPVTQADRQADQFLLDRLQRYFPPGEFGYLSEESVADDSRFSCDLVWIIDPIDGTNDFINGGEDFAIQVGLAGRLEEGAGHRSLLGVVYQPTAKRLSLAAQGLGAFEENVATGERLPLRVSDVDSVALSRMVTTKSHMSERMRELIERIHPATVYPMGSLGLKACEVARGSADMYLNPSRRGCKEWDVCAPEVILREAGGVMTDLLGRELSYNEEDFVLRNGLLASNMLLHEEILAIVGAPQGTA